MSSNNNSSAVSGKRNTIDSPTSSISGNVSKQQDSQPPKKRAKIEFDFDSKFIASSQDDLDSGVI